MNKKVITVIIILILILIGVFPITVSFNGFFFTTKFYNDPLVAYNADAMCDTVHGEIKAKNTIGLFEFDDKKALFIGELSNNRFLVAEMNIKGKKYARGETVFLYDYTEEFNEKAYNLTKTQSGYKKWMIIYNQQDIEKLSDVKLKIEYTLSNGSTLFLIIFQ